MSTINGLFGPINTFDLVKSRALRDAGIALVISNNPTFAIEFTKFVIALPHGWVGKCEDIRRIWKGKQPKHHNAWGACWNAAIKQGLLIETEIEVNMIASKAHGRKTHLYRRR